MQTLVEHAYLLFIGFIYLLKGITITALCWLIYDVRRRWSENIRMKRRDYLWKIWFECNWTESNKFSLFFVGRVNFFGCNSWFFLMLDIYFLLLCGVVCCFVGVWKRLIFWLWKSKGGWLIVQIRSQSKILLRANFSKKFSFK